MSYLIGKRKPDQEAVLHVAALCSSNSGLLAIAAEAHGRKCYFVRIETILATGCCGLGEEAGLMKMRSR